MEKFIAKSQELVGVSALTNEEKSVATLNPTYCHCKYIQGYIDEACKRAEDFKPIDEVEYLSLLPHGYRVIFTQDDDGQPICYWYNCHSVNQKWRYFYPVPFNDCKIMKALKRASKGLKCKTKHNRFALPDPEIATQSVTIKFHGSEMEVIVKVVK
jgi:hypothetical protein